MKIRKANIKDAKKISELKSKTLCRINKEYNQNQLNTWIKGETPTHIVKNIKLKDTFCLIENNKIVGVIDLNKNMIGGLFIKYNLVGKGFGKKLMDFIEKYALKKGVEKAFLYSTPYAVKFYKKLGYKTVSKGIWILRGVKFPEVKMGKNLK